MDTQMLEHLLTEVQMLRQRLDELELTMLVRAQGDVALRD